MRYKNIYNDSDSDFIFFSLQDTDVNV
jgi:hypothetical protein